MTSSLSLKAHFLIEAQTCLGRALETEQRLQLIASSPWKVCSPRSVFPGAAAQSTSPRVAASIGAFLSQILKSQYSSDLAHKQARFKSQTASSSRSYQGSSKIIKAPQLTSRYLSSLLGCSDLLTSVTCNSNAPSILHDLALPIPHPLVKLAGRTAEHLAAWKKITSDQWVLQAVSGYRLEFTSEPQQSHRPVTVQSGHKAAVISEEIGKMLEKGAILEVKGTMTDGFFSSLFLVPKKEGQMRTVLNLKPLNRFIYHMHFKMEGMHIARDLLQRGDWMMRIDIKDAYFAIPIHPHHQKFLRFQWKGKCFQFTCLPFGLVSAPRVFTKILRTVVGFLRNRGMRCVVYIDDLLLLHQDKEKLRGFSATVLVLLKSLGYLINYPKSVLEPTQNLVFLGFTINSVEKELSLPAEKLEKIVMEAKTMLKCRTVSARSLAQLIGRMTAAILAVHPAPLHYRGLQHLKHLALRRKVTRMLRKQNYTSIPWKC